MKNFLNLIFRQKKLVESTKVKHHKIEASMTSAQISRRELTILLKKVSIQLEEHKYLLNSDRNEEMKPADCWHKVNGICMRVGNLMTVAYASQTFNLCSEDAWWLTFFEGRTDDWFKVERF